MLCDWTGLCNWMIKERENVIKRKVGKVGKGTKRWTTRRSPEETTRIKQFVAVEPPTDQL
jgi:hypothetical protein